jgi:hypothetical protein
LPAGEAVNTTKDTPDDPPGWGHYKGIITQYENGKRDPYLGWGDTDLRGYPLSPTGFPQWPGKPGPEGNSTAAGIYQIEKSTWDPIAARLGIKDFSPESQERVAKEIYRERGLQPWAAFNPKLATAVGYQPQMADYWNQRAEGAIGAEMGIARQTATGMSEKMQEYAKIANAAAPGSKEADEALASLRKEAAIDRAAYREKMMKPPVEKPVDAWANFGSVATIMGLLGGLFTRQHITGALNAAGAAMEAINTNNHQIFEKSYKTWHDQTEMAHTLFQMDQEDIKDILTDKRMGIDEKTARLSALSTELGMMKATGDVLASPFEHMVTLYDRRAAAAATVANAKLQTEKATQDYFYQANIAKGMKPDEALSDAIRRAKGQLPQAVSKSAGEEREIEQTVKAADDAFKAANPNASTAEIAEAHKKNDLDARSKMALATARSATGDLSPDTVKLLAQQYEMGDPGVITSLPRSGPARVQVENQVAKDLKDMPDGAAQIVMNRLRMAEAKSAATTAGRVTMNTALFAQEAIGAGQQVVETSKLFPRTDIPLVNTALVAYERNTGDPNIIKFGAALNALINAYGKMSNPTGTGVHDADKARIERVMDASFSQGQIEAGVQQIVTEGQVMSQAAQTAQAEVLRQAMPAVPGAAPVASPASQGATTESETTLPGDLPDPSGLKDGQQAKDGDKVIAVVRGGKWVKP